MNKADVVSKVSQQTGAAPGTCQEILTAFEEEVGKGLINEFFGTKSGHADLVARVSKRTGVRPEDCDKVVTAIEEVVQRRISDKFGFLKRIFSKI